MTKQCLWGTIVSLLITVSLAGCLGGDDTVPGDGEGTGQTADPEGTEGPGQGTEAAPGEQVIENRADQLDLDGCAMQGLQFFLPMEMVQDITPEGFDPVPGDPAGLSAQMGAMSFLCTGAQSLDFDIADHAEFKIYIMVEPPQGLQDASIDAYMLNLEVIGTSPEVANLYRQWGMWADPGEISFDQTDATAARLGQVSVQTDWDAFELITVVDATDTACSDVTTTRLFQWASTVTTYVDVEQGSHCTGIGAGKLLFPEPWGTDPGALAFWVLFNGLLTGPGFQYWGDDMQITMTHVLIDGS